MSDKQAVANKQAQVKELEKKLSRRKKPWMISELAQEFGVEENTIRQWIKMLGTKVTVSDAPKRNVGKGRPPKQYTIVTSESTPAEAPKG